jgi:hypothetical protein
MRQALTALLLFIEAFVGWNVPAAAAVPTAQPIMSVALAGSPIAHVSANRRRTGGGGGLTIPYNTQFGVTDPATGWITFPLHAGNRRIWVNSRVGEGSDSNNCLSAAAPCATFDHAWVVYRAGHTGGDQLMIAGKAPAYTDHGVTDDFHNLNSGISLTYPNAILSYDPTDAANSAKYGKLVGPDMPVVIEPQSVTWERSFGDVEGTGTGYQAVQGIAFDAQGASDVAIQFAANDATQHNGIVFQNTRWQGVRLTMGLGPSGPPSCQVCGTLGGPFLISKSSGYGQWATNGNFSWIDVNFTDGYQEQEVIGGHAGWKVGVDRFTESFTTGGPTIFGHGRYYAANSRNGKSDFTVWFDNAVDGDNARGGIVENYTVAINEPTVGTTGGFSVCVCEAPNGVLIQRNTGLVIGASDGGAAIGPRGSAWGNQNTVPGSHIDNFLMLANPFWNDGPPNHKVQIIGPCNNSDMIEQYLAMTRITAYHYSWEIQGDGVDCSTSPSRIHVTWANTKTDQLAPGIGNSVSAAGDFPGSAPWTSVNQLPTAMGQPSLARLYNLMLYRPDLPWARAIVTAAFTAHGKGQPLSGVPPPDTTGITPPQVYPEGATTLGALALSSTTYTRGSATSGSITGATAGSTLTTTGIPSGLTINSGARTWAWDGTGTGAASGTWTLTEALTGATNTPRGNTISYTINAAGGGGTTWDGVLSNSGYSLSGGSLTATRSTGSGDAAVIGSQAKTTGTFTVTVTSGGTGNQQVGVVNSSFSNATFVGGTDSVGYISGSGAILVNGLTDGSAAPSYGTGDAITFVANGDGTFGIKKNGTLVHTTAVTGFTSVRPAASTNGTGAVFDLVATGW